jgi:restriction system protein
VGAIWFSANEYASFLSEAAGYKTGVVLSRDELAALFKNDLEVQSEFLGPDDAPIRIRSEDLEQRFASILFRLGNTDNPSTVRFTTRMFHKYKADAKLAELCQRVLMLYVQETDKMMASALASGTKQLNPAGFIQLARKKYGRAGWDMAIEAVDGAIRDQHRDLSRVRRIAWKDQLELQELFNSESLIASYGEFIDQRFIDYLYRNQDRLGEIHWRKFEGLAGEFFAREGYKVEMGPGRGDGGVDVRVWKQDVQPGEAPLILVQCKRQKEKVDRAVVKALWADVQWENAESGLIVTTSAISPGAVQDCIARGYDIRQADKAVIAEWLTKLRSPGTGIFMGR